MATKQLAAQLQKMSEEESRVHQQIVDVVVKLNRLADEQRALHKELAAIQGKLTTITSVRDGLLSSDV